MAQIKILYRNILENSTVTPSNENSTYPSYRLYDRDIGKLFKGNSSVGDFYITIDQGASASNPIYAIDHLVIPIGHNLNGSSMMLEYSTGGAYVSATSWSQSSTGTINKTITTTGNHRYWRLDIVQATAVPELPELFLGQDYTFQRNPSFGSRTGIKANVMREETQSGKRRAIQLGELRETRTYDLSVIETTQKDDFETWIEHTEGLKPVYLTDEEGNVLYVELLNDLDFSYKARNNIYSVVLEFQEVI